MIRHSKHLAALAASMVIAVSAGGCGDNTVTLFNGKDFTGWERVVDGDADINEVWTVRDGVVHCTGVPNGYMRTVGEYGDYILTLEWRWIGTGTNSGVFLHTQGPDKVWPRCIECQLKSGSAGDFVLIGKGAVTVDGKVYDNREGFMAVPKMAESSERPIGEWNTYRIECRGDTISSTVNGVLQNRAVNASASRGWIALQSEGGPIEFRNIRLELLD